MSSHDDGVDSNERDARQNHQRGRKQHRRIDEDCQHAERGKNRRGKHPTLSQRDDPFDADQNPKKPGNHQRSVIAGQGCDKRWKIPAEANQSRPHRQQQSQDRASNERKTESFKLHNHPQWINS